jgi:hypothetical protein
MTPDENDLLCALVDRAIPGKRPSIVETGMQQLPEWAKDRLLVAAQGLEKQGYILNAVGPLLNVDLSSTARKHVAVLRAPLPAQSIHIGTNNHSPVQQVGHGASGIQTVTHNVTRDDLEKLVILFREHGAELDLDQKSQRQVDSYVSTIEAQINLDEPNSVIVREAGKSLKTISEGAIGSIIAAGATNPGLWHWFLGLF